MGTVDEDEEEEWRIVVSDNVPVKPIDPYGYDEAGEEGRLTNLNFKVEMCTFWEAFLKCPDYLIPGWGHIESSWHSAWEPEEDSN